MKHNIRFNRCLTVLLFLFGYCSLYSEEDESAEERFPADSRPVTELGLPQVVSYSEMLEKVRPSVVSVYTARMVRVVRRQHGNSLEDMLRFFYGIPNPRRQNEVEEHPVREGVGSGVIVSADGYILTNKHVITDRFGNEVDEVLIKLKDGRELEAKIIGGDEKTDIAVLKVEGEDLPAVQIADSNNLKVGDVVFAIGNPLDLGQTTTMGIISATGRSELGLLGEHSYENFIQTDASINDGNSGGALVDAGGRLIGINTAIISRSGGNIGLGFAVPVNLARHILISLTTEGVIKRGFLGVEFGDLTPDIAEAFGLQNTNGVLVNAVGDSSPAANAGLKRGDVIVSFGGQVVATSKELRLMIAQTQPGSRVEVKVIRRGETQVFFVKLGDRDDPLGLGTGATVEILTGVKGRSLNDELRESFAIEHRDVEGVVVTEVAANSPFGRGPNAFLKGMVIIEVNDQPVKEAQHIRKRLRVGINKFWVYFQGTNRFIPVRAR